MASASALAAEQKVTVRGGVHDNANRLVFDWPRNTPYTIKRDGGQVTLTFSADAAFDVTRSAQKLSRLGAISSQQQDGKTIVTFAVDPSAKVQDFLSGTYVVLDVTGASVPVGTVPAPAPVAEKPVAQSAQTVTPPPIVTPTPPPTKPVADVKPVAPIVPPVAPAAPLQAPTSSAPKAPGPGIIVTTGIQPPAPVATPAVNLNAPITLATIDEMAEILPATVYNRAGDTYLVFDRRVKLKPPESDGTVAPTLIDGGSFTAYRFAGVEAPVTLKREGTVWKLYALPLNSVDTAADIVPDAQPAYALGSRMVIPLNVSSHDKAAAANGVPPTGQVISFKDPLVGDTLFAVPTLPGQSVQARHYVDFDLLPTWQGVLIRTKNDGLLIHRIAEGVELTLPGGMKLSDPRLAALQQPKTVEGAAPVKISLPSSQKLMLDINKWAISEAEFTPAYRSIMMRVAQTNPKNRDAVRLELARFFMARGNGPEALAILQLIAADDTSIVNKPEFLALRGASYTLSNKADLALTDFARIDATNYPDVKLWQGIASALQHDDTNAAQLLVPNVDLVAAYPEPFLTKFSLMAAETFIDSNDNEHATRVLNNLATRTEGAAMRLPQILYLRGVLQSRLGSMGDAEKLWQQAAGSNDELASARARLALVNLHLATHTTTAQEAAVQLERLSFAWRGDNMELSVLERLSELYEAANQYEDALRTLDHARRVFPNSVHDGELKTRQQQVFRNMFLSKTDSGQLSPLKMLATYEQYKQFLPADPAEREVIAGKLVDKMIEMDLLPGAISLLTTQVQDEIDPVRKGRLAARLAGIQLLNLDDKAAQATLDGSENPALPDELQKERRLLRARALSDQGQQQQALELLKDDQSDTAKRLKATIAWQAKDWKLAAASLDGLVPVPAPGISVRLTPAQADIIMSRAIALSLTGDQAALTALGNNFGAAMKDTAQASAFAFLASGNSDTGMAPTLSAVESQVKSVDLFQGFLESYRKQ